MSFCWAPLLQVPFFASEPSTSHQSGNAEIPPKPSPLMNFYRKIRQFLTKDLWDVDVKQLPFPRRVGYSFLRMLIIAIRGFMEDRCTLQASALTYITLVSLVPILAITLAFCKGIGLQNKLMETMGLERIVKITPDAQGILRHEVIYHIRSAQPAENATTPTDASQEASTEKAEAAVVLPVQTAEGVVLAPAVIPSEEGTNVLVVLPTDQNQTTSTETSASEQETSTPEQEPSTAEQEPSPSLPSPHHPNFAAELPEPMQTALVKLFTYVDKTNFAALGLVGIAALLFSVLSAIRKLEDNFNAIWCVKKGRNILEQFSQYLIVLLLFPIALLLTVSTAAFVHSNELAKMLHTSSPAIIMLGNLLGNFIMYLFLLTGFVFLYFFMPHTRVRFVPAFIGGFFGSLVWLGVLFVYLRWQVGLAKFNAIYGGFAALPFFLAWLYTSWVVVLLGAEITYAVQHIRLTRLTKHLPPPDPATNHLLGIAAMESICRQFETGKGPWNAANYAATHAIALNELTAALDLLVRAKLIIQLTPNADPPVQYDYIPSRPPAQITLAEVQEAFFGMEEGRAQEISQFLPEKLITALQNYHRENLRELSEINFEK